MAVTKGHGNPKWTREETILALELYHECGGVLPGSSDPRVIALSLVLNALPQHEAAARKESFRNPAGVAFKLQNLRRVGSDRGLDHSSKTDKAIWNEYGNDVTKTRRAAEAIRSSLKLLQETTDIDDSDDEFPEGRLVTQVHRRRERHPDIRQKMIKARLVNGLSCDLCGYKSTRVDPDYAAAGFECHHLMPLAAGNGVRTKLNDIALLCAICHRLIHRAISKSGRWLNLADARLLLFDAQSSGNERK